MSMINSAFNVLVPVSSKLYQRTMEPVSFSLIMSYTTYISRAEAPASKRHLIEHFCNKENSFDSVGVLVICVLVLTAFLYCLIYVYLFLFVTSVRTTATE
jgi:hypothetical protein